MTLSKEQLEKMQIWHSTVALMGVDVDDLEDDWIDESFVSLLEDLEKHYERLESPDTNMKAAILTHDMGVSLNDISDYTTHLSEIETARLKEEREQRIATNEHLVRLWHEHNFQFIKPKQYPTHKNFTFNDKNGLLIRGRIFRFNWSTVRVWMYWKDKKGKSHSSCYNYHRGDNAIHYPNGFPSDWDEDRYYKYTFDTELLCYIIAHKTIQKKMGKGFVYPKA
jgi:hypothetical protein